MALFVMLIKIFIHLNMSFCSFIPQIIFVVRHNVILCNEYETHLAYLF